MWNWKMSCSTDSIVYAKLLVVKDVIERVRGLQDDSKV